MTTPALERSLPSGLVTLGPVVDGGVVAHGDDEQAEHELLGFLAEHLATLPPAQAARYFLPEGVEVITVEVALDPGLPTRLRPPRLVGVACVVVPHGVGERSEATGGGDPASFAGGAGGNPPGGIDRWGFVPALDASFFVHRREDFLEVARREIARVARARGLDGDDWRRVLPALDTQVVPLELTVRFAAATEATGDRLAAEHRRVAAEVLDAIAVRLAERVRGGGVELVGRDRELASLDALLGGRDRLSVLLSGDEAVGKTALVLAWARRHPARPAWVTSVAQLVAGASGFGEAEARMQSIFGAAEALDAVLYFEDFGSLFRERPEEGGLDVAAVVRRNIVEGRVRVVAEITPFALERAERRDVGLVGAMTRVPLAPMTPAQALVVARAHATHWRRAEPRRPQLADATVAVAVELARRYLPYRMFPGKAVRLLDELRSARDGAVGLDGAPLELGPEDAYEGFSLVTGIPTFLLRDDQAMRVGELVARLRTRMIGQDVAVQRVAETLCTVKAQLQPADKPLATFLFVGPTGVGKTELARSLAHLLFGGEERLVRFDMSEYADPWAAERLIRGSGDGDGLLTSRVREQPFSVVLLDEIEKAHPAVHDLLLQVAGEGRLTDARGRTSYFHNTIIILTSNLGAHHGGGAVGLRASSGDGRERELGRYQAAVATAFRPEMLNRFDAVIAFHRLSEAEVADVACLQVARLADRRGLVQAAVGLDVSERALAALAVGGYSAAYGVRALRRHLDEQVVAPAARLLARVGSEGHGGLLAVRVDGEPVGLGLSEGSHLGTVAPAAGPVEAPALRVSLYRRVGASARRGAQGLTLLAEVRREADTWLARDVATEVRDQVSWLEAQLAQTDESRARAGRAGRSRRDVGGKARKEALSAEQRQQMATELHRLRRGWDDAHAARDEITAAEDLGLEVALAGGAIEEVAAMAGPLAARFATAMFWLAVARLEQRDAITLALSAPELSVPLERWLGALLAEAPARRWTITGHLTGVRDPAVAWPESRVWGPPRSAAWLSERLAGEGGIRNVLLRVRGPGAACLLGLEAGTHRFVGIAKVSPCHLVVRRIALTADFDDDAWLRVGALAAPAQPGKGNFERLHAATDHVMVMGRRVEVAWPRYMAQLEEVGLARIARALADDEAVADLYPIELTEPAAPETEA